jgi:hypothetical protein
MTLKEIQLGLYALTHIFPEELLLLLCLMEYTHIPYTAELVATCPDTILALSSAA